MNKTYPSWDPWTISSSNSERGIRNFTGEMAEELLRLVKAGTIKVIDAIILTEDKDGVIDTSELADAGDLGELVEFEAELAELLAAEDVEKLANAMDPGSVAGVLVYANVWAAPLRVRRTASRRSAHRQRPHPHPSDHRLARGR